MRTRARHEVRAVIGGSKALMLILRLLTSANQLMPKHAASLSVRGGGGVAAVALITKRS